MDDRKIVLELRNIVKTFPGVRALDNVSLTLYEGSVLALIGENGAGKSTLIKVITGVYKPDQGEVSVNGKPVSFDGPHDAFDHGISVVHQERNICETFTVAQNIYLEQMTGKAFQRVDLHKYNQMAKKYLDMVNLNVDPSESVTVLKPGQKQILEIARALSMDAKIIMLDEPTASISAKEAATLLEIVKRLTRQGYSFIFVSHKLDEVFDIANDITVLRDGVNTAEFHITSDSDRKEIRESAIVAMVGRTEKSQTYPCRDRTLAPVVLEANALVSKSHPRPRSFQLHKGEILGWYGLVGAGRTELIREIIGIDSLDSGSLMLHGQKIHIRNPKEAIEKYGIAYVSENRNEEGVFLSKDIAVNIGSSILNKISKKGWINFKKGGEIADNYIRQLEIKCTGRTQKVITMSGGNRQKVSVAKVLASDPVIIIFDEPTVGIDIKTKDEIYDIIWQLAEDGKSIIMISSDMKEMIHVADRIVVFADSMICDDLKNTRVYKDMSTRIMTSIMNAADSHSTNNG